jgi:hypothetical protein
MYGPRSAGLQPEEGEEGVRKKVSDQKNRKKEKGKEKSEKGVIRKRCQVPFPPLFALPGR